MWYINVLFDFSDSEASEKFVFPIPVPLKDVEPRFAIGTAIVAFLVGGLISVLGFGVIFRVSVQHKAM